MDSSETVVLEADLDQKEHQDCTVQLLNAYAMKPMGDGKPLSEIARRDVISGLRQHPTTLVFLAYRDDVKAGIAICFRGFSTFMAWPLINISDYYVIPPYRGMRVGRCLMQKIKQHARELGCCKLTREVQDNNRRARAVYIAVGFGQAVHVPEAGGSLFLSKPL